MGYDIRKIRAVENGKDEFDFDKTVYEANKDLFDSFGREPLSFQVENEYGAERWADWNEAPLSHGYPTTQYFQLAIIYACGLYTAREQGIVKRGVYFQRFWRHHYFDWITFAKRSFWFGVVGGIIGGTYLFGNTELAWARVQSKFRYWVKNPPQEPMDSWSCYNIKINN